MFTLSAINSYCNRNMRTVLFYKSANFFAVIVDSICSKVESIRNPLAELI